MKPISVLLLTFGGAALFVGLILLVTGDGPVIRLVLIVAGLAAIAGAVTWDRHARRPR